MTRMIKMAEKMRRAVMSVTDIVFPVNKANADIHRRHLLQIGWYFLGNEIVFNIIK